MKQILVLIISFTHILCGFSQSVGIGTTTPDPSAILDLSSTSQGVLVPRMDSTSRTQITGVIEGLMIYQTNGNKGFYYYTGTEWQKIGGEGNEWLKNGANEIYTAKAIGIGNSNPDDYAILDITSTTKGILIPRMTEAQRNAILNPEDGLLIFQGINNKGFYFFNGSNDLWTKVGGDSWIDDVDDPEVHTIKQVGIGSNNPKTRLHISQGNEANMIDTSGFVLIGNSTSSNLIIDNNEIQARNNSAASSLVLQEHGGSVGIGTSTVSNSALLDLTSTSQGFLMPRMSTLQRDAILNPTQGLKIFNTDDRCEDTYDGQKWAKNCDMKQNGDTTLPANNWRPRADYPGGERYFTTCFSIGAKIYMGLGQRTVNDSTIRRDFWEYNTETDIWTRKADFGGGFRTEAVGFSIGSKGYIGTGYDGVLNKKDFWEYDPTTNIWTQMLDFGGTARNRAVGFSIGPKGYIGTGDTNSGETNDFWEYDQSLNTWTQKANFGGLPRDLAVGFSIGPKGYIGTGISGGELKDFWEFTPAGSGLGAWVQRADFGGDERYSAVGFSIGSKGYIGTGSGNPRNEFWEFNPITNIWTRKADVNGKERSLPCGCSVGNKGYIGAGYSENNLPMLNDFWVYNSEPEQGKEYVETIPKDAVSYKSHDWTSEGNKLSTTLTNVNAEINGTLVVKDSTIIGDVKINNRSIGINSQNNYSLTIQDNGYDVVIGGPTSTTSDLTINGNQPMSSITSSGVLNLGRNLNQYIRLKMDNNKIQTSIGSDPYSLLLQPYGGDIGIGLNFSSPDALLHLKGQQNNDFRHIMLEDDNSSAYSLVTCSDNFVVINSSNTGDFIFRNGSNSVDVLSVTPTGNLTINGSTATKIGGSGSWVTTSDIRLKKDISSYHDGLSKVLEINPVKFKYNSYLTKDTLNEYVGVIAQELKKVVPYMVGTFNKNGEEYLNVDNGAMTYMLINAVKELAKENDELIKKLENQASFNLEIKSKLEKLENLISQNNKQ